MGKLLPSYKKSVVDEIINGIAGNTSQYYAYASNPIPYEGVTPSVTSDDYSTYFVNSWLMLFGKRIANSDVLPICNKNFWVSNTQYDKYDNSSNTLYEDNNYYVVSQPATVGGDYLIYKCIDNANGSLSTVNPSSVGTPTQATTFQTSDNYKWRYITSISSAIYDKFATNQYIPVYPNTSIQNSANSYSGVEVVMIANGGSGYSSYGNGFVRGVQNSTVIQIENNSSENNDFYVNNSIYIYNTSSATSQLRIITDYVSNSTGKWVYVDTAVNTQVVTPAVTQYIISPQVYFNTDGDSQPKAYTTINTTSNSIQSIVILDIGSNISRANAHIISNTNFGSGASLRCIVPPPGGHGFDPVSELNVQGYAFSFNFANTQGNTIVTSNVVYNKIGLIKNPYVMDSNGDKGARYSSNTFSQILKANVNPTFTFTVGETVTGANSGAKGVVVFANSSQVYLAGDKTFEDGETVANAAGSEVTTISIQTLGDIYAKDLKPLYVQNINNVNRLDNQTESFKLIIKV